MKSDEQVQQDVMDELKWEPSIHAAQIGVEVRDGVVTLAGEVGSYPEKWGAEQVVLRVAGVKALAVFTHGPGIIFTVKQPVTSAADAGKLKFRIGGGNINELSKLMGWNTTLKPATDSFELLSTGVMDGTFFPDESLQSMRLQMVKHATTFPGGLYNTSFVFMMNPAKYNSLKPEERAVIDKVSGEAATRLFAAGWDRTDAASRDIQKQTGVQRQMANEAFVNDVKAKQAALEDRWVAAAEGRGLKNARAVLSEFRAETQKLK